MAAGACSGVLAACDVLDAGVASEVLARLSSVVWSAVEGVP